MPYACPLGADLASTEALRRFTPLSFSIYEIFGLLGEYRQVLWLDSDICIQDDIAGVFNFGPVGIRHGGATIESAFGGNSIDPAFDHLPTNNTGVVLVTDALAELCDPQALREECYACTRQYLKILRLPDTYNYTVYHDLRGFAQAKIFHLACEPKFWNHPVLYSLFPTWAECCQEWLTLGGSAYAGKQIYAEVGNKFSLFNMLQALNTQEA